MVTGIITSSIQPPARPTMDARVVAVLFDVWRDGPGLKSRHCQSKRSGRAQNRGLYRQRYDLHPLAKH